VLAILGRRRRQGRHRARDARVAWNRPNPTCDQGRGHASRKLKEARIDERTQRLALVFLAIMAD